MQSIMNWILPIVNKVSFTFITICLHDIITRASVVIEIFCHKVTLLHRMTNSKTGIIQSNMKRFLPNCYQIIYTLDTAGKPNIIILANKFMIYNDYKITSSYHWNVKIL